jgi:predicted dienelactone hydrolase
MAKATPSPIQMGARTLQFEDTSRKRPVPVELWYPAALSTKDPAPKELIAVAETGKKYPLVLLSHGHGGDRLSLSWLADSLVQEGFIVASVEHHGNSRHSYNPMASLRFWERPRDVSFALNQLLKEPSLKGKIDTDRIGFVGYSLGGMTGLALAGAEAQNVKQIVLQQQANYKEIDPELVETIDFSQAQVSFKEPRIKAMVLLAPATFVYPPQSLKNVKIPTALVVSIADEVLPFKEHGLRLITHMTPAELKVCNHSHHAFVSPTPDPVHKEVSQLTTTFFKEQL